MILQFEKVATPAMAALGLEEQPSVPPLVGVFMARATVEVLLVTTSPSVSSTVTIGGVAKVVPLLALPRVVVNTNWVAVPATVKLVLVAWVSPADVALSV